MFSVIVTARKGTPLAARINETGLPSVHSKHRSREAATKEAARHQKKIRTDLVATVVKK